MINFQPWNLMTRLQWEAASWTANFWSCLKKFNTLLAAKAVLMWFEINCNTNLRDISNLIDLGPMDITWLAVLGLMLYHPRGCYGMYKFWKKKWIFEMKNWKLGIKRKIFPFTLDIQTLYVGWKCYLKFCKRNSKWPDYFIYILLIIFSRWQNEK